MIFILLFTLLLINNFAQVNLTIIVYSNLGNEESVFISGNKPEFGNWNPSQIKFNKLNDSTWLNKFKFEKSVNLEFKLTKGSWNNEALNSEGTVPPNYSLILNNDTTLIYNINNWKDEIEQIYDGQITGNVLYHKNLTYEGLKSRDISVWLPPNYESEIDNRYPVLYVKDGQNVFDPSTSTFGIDVQMDEAADSLIKNNLIEPIIIVAINNTSDRYFEYSHGEKGELYMQFIVNKIKPFIDSTYRTKPDRKNTAVFGSSMGGLISFMLLWEYNEIFSKAVAVSPAFKIRDFNYIPFVEEYSTNKKDLKLLISNGGTGIDIELQPGIDEMIYVLETQDYKLGQEIILNVFPEDEHSEKDWAKRFPQQLQYLFGINQ